MSKGNSTETGKKGRTEYPISRSALLDPRGVCRRNGEIYKAAAESGVPGVSFIHFMMTLPFLILYIHRILLKLSFLHLFY